MDLDDFNLQDKSEEGAKLVIKHPVFHTETDVVFYIKGKDSSTYRNTFMKLAREEKPEDVPNDEWVKLKGAKLLASCVTGWENVQKGGKNIEFSYENAVEIFNDDKLDPLTSQVYEAIRDRTLFFGESGTS